MWSYGVTIWEIFSFGQTPYYGLTNEEILEKILLGYRLPPPKGIPKALYSMALQCWIAARPTFTTLRQFLEDWSASGDKDLVLEEPQLADPTEAFENEKTQPASNYALLKTFRHDDSGRAAPLLFKGLSSSKKKKSRGSASSSISGDNIVDSPKSREASEFLPGK